MGVCLCACLKFFGGLFPQFMFLLDLHLQINENNVSAIKEKIHAQAQLVRVELHASRRALVGVRRRQYVRLHEYEY